MKIYLDDVMLNVDNPEDNIVTVARKNGITILAPCFTNQHKHGCCKTCLIEVDGKQAFACSTKPYDGMKIKYNDDKLNHQRIENLKVYGVDKPFISDKSKSSCCDKSNDRNCCN